MKGAFSVMRDFDVARKERREQDRSFVIGGERFVFKADVAPEVILDWMEFAASANREATAVASFQAALAAARAKNAEALGAGHTLPFPDSHIAELEERLAVARASLEEKSHTEREWLELLDATITEIIEPGYHPAWQKVRDPHAEHPLSLGDLNELAEWLIEEVVARPTKPQSVSSPSGETSGTSSTGASSLREVEASAA